MKGWLTDSNGGYKAVLLIIGFSFLCWGRLIGMDGIWWDDWAWVWHYFGVDDFDEFMRPFKWLNHTTVGYLLFFNFRLFEPFHEYASNIWSVFRFIIFTVNALLIYAIARSLLRDKSVLPLAVSVVYLASPVVNNLCLVTFNYHVFLFFYLLSILLSIKAIAGKKIRLAYYLLAILCSYVSMVSLESFVFFDVLRPLIFLYVFLKKDEGNLSKSVKRSLLYWVPFILVGALILLYTILVPQSGAYAGVYSTRSLSVEFLNTVIDRYVNSLKYVFIEVYSLTFKYALIKEGDILFILISMGAALYACFVLLKRRRLADTASASPDAFREAKLIAIFGLVAVVVGLLPYVLAREVVSYGLNSRHGLLAAIGASIFFPSFLLVLYYKKLLSRRLYQILFGVLVFLGALQCNYSVGVYKDNWEHQRSIWWQLIWRAPDIKENTFMIIDMPWPESPGGGSYVLPAALNLGYAKSGDKAEIFNHYAFALFNAFRRDETNYRGIYDKLVVELQIYRGIAKFYPKNLIAASYDGGYLYINDEIIRPVFTTWSDVEFMVSNASPDRIIYEDSNPEFPFRWIIGPEPEHDWRYYYQKSNALSGRGDQAGVVRLFNEAQRAGYDLAALLPQNLMPFIKAFYLDGDFKMAGSLLKNWASSPGGSRDRALELLESEGIRDNPALYEEIQKEIKHIWG